MNLHRLFCISSWFYISVISVVTNSELMIWNLFFFSDLGFHTPNDGIHDNDNQQHDCHGYPESHIDSQPFASSKNIDPKSFPIQYHESHLLEQLAVMADVCFFDTRCQDHVQQNAWNQIGKVNERQIGKAKGRSQR